MVYGVARVCKGINLRGREAYATVPNKGIVVMVVTMPLRHCFSCRPPSHEQRQSVPDAEVGIQSAPPSVTERPLSAFSMASSQDEERVHYVILDFSPVNYIDSQAVAALTAVSHIC